VPCLRRGLDGSRRGHDPKQYGTGPVPPGARPGSRCTGSSLNLGVGHRIFFVRVAQVFVRWPVSLPNKEASVHLRSGDGRGAADEGSHATRHGRPRGALGRGPSSPPALRPHSPAARWRSSRPRSTLSRVGRRTATGPGSRDLLRSPSGSGGRPGGSDAGPAERRGVLPPRLLTEPQIVGGSGGRDTEAAGTDAARCPGRDGGVPSRAVAARPRRRLVA
jgi:hypothetical protein